MAKYILTMAVDGVFTVDVEAESLGEAMELADAAFDDADFGELGELEREYVWYSEDGEPHDLV